MIRLMPVLDRKVA